MDTRTAIRVENLSKSYRMYDTPLDRLKESLHPLRKKYHRDFFALRDVSFEIEKGRTVGIVGRNGSGKSTLLKIITGVLTPTSGSVTVDGRVSALLELGTGFNLELTGIENIYFSGTITGYTKEQMDGKLDHILSFADIGEFANQPLKTYSSGMYVRLAFAVATNIDPEILIVDEALSVGDTFFQSKCMDKMKRMLDNGITLLYVSHDSGSIKSLCEKSILLDRGRVAAFESSDNVIQKYFSLKVENEQRLLEVPAGKAPPAPLQAHEREGLREAAFLNNSEFQKRASYQRLRNGKAGFANIQLLDENGREVFLIEYEQELTLRMAVEAHEDIPSLAYGYHIRDKNGVDIVYSDCVIEGCPVLSLKAGDRCIIDWRFKASLSCGIYNIACVLSMPINLELSQVEFCDFVPLAVQFEMRQRKGSYLYGRVHWDNTVEVQRCHTAAQPASG